MGKTENTGGGSVLSLLSLTLQAACREKLWSFGKPIPGAIDGGLAENRLGGGLLDGAGLVVNDEL